MFGFLWLTLVDVAVVVIVDDDCVVWPSVVDTGEVVVDVMVGEYCDVGPTVVDSAGNAVVVVADVGW